MCVAFVFGSRDLFDYNRVLWSFDTLCPGVAEVWSGAALGVDATAEEIGRRKGLRVRLFPAQWDTLGRSAGIKRTVQLVGALPRNAACVCVLSVPFPGAAQVAAAGGVRAFLSAGSAHSVRICLERGLSVACVWSCYSVSWCRPGPRPPAPFPPVDTWRHAADVTDTSDRPTARRLSIGPVAVPRAEGTPGGRPPEQPRYTNRPAFTGELHECIACGEPVIGHTHCDKCADRFALGQDQPGATAELPPIPRRHG